MEKTAYFREKHRFYAQQAPARPANARPDSPRVRPPKYGVVVNAPMTNDNVAMIKKVIDIPIVATVVSDSTDTAVPAAQKILNLLPGTYALRDVPLPFCDISPSFHKKSN